MTSRLAGRFHRTEQTTEYSIIDCIGSVYADSLTADEIKYIKGFYSYSPDSKHEIITQVGSNGKIKVYAN
jgi:hypothetical protein